MEYIKLDHNKMDEQPLIAPTKNHQKSIFQQTGPTNKPIIYTYIKLQ